MTREEIIKELNKIRCIVAKEEGDSYTSCPECIELIANYIIKDRERVVAPLVKVSDMDENCEYVNEQKLWEAIDETLKLAAIDTDK